MESSSGFGASEARVLTWTSRLITLMYCVSCCTLVLGCFCEYLKPYRFFWVGTSICERFSLCDAILTDEVVSLSFALASAASQENTSVFRGGASDMTHSEIVQRLRLWLSRTRSAAKSINCGGFLPKVAKDVPEASKSGRYGTVVLSSLN